MSLFAEKTEISLSSLRLPQGSQLEANCKIAVGVPAINVSAILSRVTGELERYNGIISGELRLNKGIIPEGASVLNKENLASHVDSFVQAAQKIYTKLEQCHQAYTNTKDQRFIEMQNIVLQGADRQFEGVESKGLIDFLRAGMELEHNCVNLAKAAKGKDELLDAYDLFSATRKALNYFCERDPNGDFIRDAIEPIASNAIYGSQFHSTFFAGADLRDMATMLRKIDKTPRAFDPFDPNRDPAHVLGQSISYAANSVLGKMNAYAKDALDQEQMLNAKSDWDR